MAKKSKKIMAIILQDNRTIWLQVDDVKELKLLGTGANNIRFYSILLNDGLFIPSCRLKNDKIYEKALTIINARSKM